jgi:hypothetical protein
MGSLAQSDPVSTNRKPSPQATVFLAPVPGEAVQAVAGGVVEWATLLDDGQGFPELLFPAAPDVIVPGGVGLERAVEIVVPLRGQRRVVIRYCGLLFSVSVAALCWTDLPTLAPATAQS